VKALTVVIAHREPMVAEGIAAALDRYRGLLPIATVTSASDTEVAGARADAVAIDAGLDGARTTAESLRRAGVQVVLVGDELPAEDERFVSTRNDVAALARALNPGARSAASFGRSHGLTHREREVLMLVAKGLAAKQVARQMGISPKTVEQHKTRIFAKLGVPNAAAAVGLLLSADRKGDAA